MLSFQSNSKKWKPFQERCLEAFNMVLSLTHHRRVSCNKSSNKNRVGYHAIKPLTKIGCLEPLVVELLAFIPRRSGKAPKSVCDMCWEVHAVRSKVLRRLPKVKKHVSKACGGSMCAKWVCDRIKLTFLNEEQKILVKVWKVQAQSQKALKKKSFYE